MAILNKVRKALKPDAQDDIDGGIIEETTKIWEYLKESRRRTEYEWFINDTYYNNNQYLKYNTGARRVQSISVEKANDRVVINKVKQQVRGVVNFLNAEHPSIGIRPGDQADNAYVRAKKEKHLCDYWYRHLGLNKVFKNISLDACKYGWGVGKILIDKDALSPTTPFTNTDKSISNHTYGEVMVARCDPFEIYPDPMGQTKGDMRYICHAVVRTIAELQSNDLYKNTEKLTPDTRLAASTMKQAQLRLNISNANMMSQGQANKMDTLVVLEIFRKIYNKEAQKWEIWVTTRTESGTLLRNEKWMLDEFPFSFFQTDIAGMLMESKGVIHDIREPNRALNEMVSQVHETARIMGKLNWLMPRGSNVNVITDETGQFIEYDITPGGAPRQADAINLPSYIMQHIGQLSAFIEDISGMHASFNGRAPFAQASGDLVDSLSEGDQNNLTMMRDNYDDFSVDTFKLMLKTAKECYKTTRNFPSNKEDEFGETTWMEIKADDISTQDDLSVSTGTQMPYSIAQKQQMYMNLWKEKAITDPQMLFKLLEMPDIDAAMGDDEADVEKQLDEIRTVLAEKILKDPQIFQNHGVHIQVLDKFCKGDRWDKLTPIQQQALLDHRQKHIQFTIQIAQISAAQQMEPIKRSETVMLRMNKMSDTTAIERTQLLAKFGVNSDAGQIQLRGGLYIQDPAQAEMQAQNEDIEMMDSRAVQVSFGDNHLVHLQTHGPVLDQLVAAAKNPDAKKVPSATVIGLFKEHIKDHVNAMQSTQVSPGLVPNDQISMPNQPNLSDTTPANQMPQGDTAPSGPAAHPVPPAKTLAPANKVVQNGEVLKGGANAKIRKKKARKSIPAAESSSATGDNQ